MPKYVVDRDVPGARGWTAEQMRTVTEKSGAVLQAKGLDMRGGLPCDRVSPVRAVIEPITAEG